VWAYNFKSLSFIELRSLWLKHIICKAAHIQVATGLEFKSVKSLKDSKFFSNRKKQISFGNFLCYIMKHNNYHVNLFLEYFHSMQQ